MAVDLLTLIPTSCAAAITPPPRLRPGFVPGNALASRGILSGDILIADAATPPAHGRVAMSCSPAKCWWRSSLIGHRAELFVCQHEQRGRGAKPGRAAAPARQHRGCRRAEALIAAQAERARVRQVEELRKAQELKHTLRPRGPSLGM
jgi:hypothetical protein